VLQNDKIVEQIDTFGHISDFKFFEMALGFPSQFLTLLPITSRILRAFVQKIAAEKLNQFMKDHEY
jgi:hypothetical protein